MERLRRMRQPSRTVVVTAVLAMASALFVTLGGHASASSPNAKTVKAAATITVAMSSTQPEDHALFTMGHAMVAGQCGGPTSEGGVITKITITAVGGPIAITTPGPGRMLAAGEKDALGVVGRSPSDIEPVLTWSVNFAVFDEAGPSFSGTAGVWMMSNDGPCMFTAQVAG